MPSFGQLISRCESKTIHFTVKNLMPRNPTNRIFFKKLSITITVVKKGGNAAID